MIEIDTVTHTVLSTSKFVAATLHSPNWNQWIWNHLLLKHQL